VLLFTDEGVSDESPRAAQLQAWGRVVHQARAERYRDAQQVIALIGGATVVITPKLHCGIVATALDVPTVCVPMHHKTQRFHRSIGNADRCLTDPDEESLAAALLAALADADGLAGMAEQRRLALENDAAIDYLLRRLRP
jgi:polysaccharide pyruvyl transferase WcaK-like protein